MYISRYFCNSLEYVQSNLGKGQIVEYIELDKDKLPEPLYEDDSKRYWELWKKVRGYKLYSVDSLLNYPIKELEDNNINEGYVRLYRVGEKSKLEKAVKKAAVPFVVGS